MIQPTVYKVIKKIHTLLINWKRTYMVWRHTKHRYGLKKISLRDTDVVLVCLIKDGEYYLQEFIDHHRLIGIKHFLIIDNGSSDKTIEIASKASDVTIYENTLPVKNLECLLRSQIAKHVVTGGWFIFVDSDELISFARGDSRGISDFVKYCNKNGYNGVIGQVLDLFSETSIEATSRLSYSESLKIFKMYSLNDIASFDYHDKKNIDFHWFMRNNKISNNDIKFKFGGIRNEVFGENCCLTTHRLVRNQSNIELYSHPHTSGNLNLADFTFLIKHYKFAGNFRERDRRNTKEATWIHGEDKLRIKFLETKDDFVIEGREQYELNEIEELIDNGFIVCSERYLAHFKINST